MSTIGSDLLGSFLSRGRFSRRHLGSHNRDIEAMLETLECASLEELISKTVPEEIRLRSLLNIPAAATDSTPFDVISSPTFHTNLRLRLERFRF